VVCPSGTACCPTSISSSTIWKSAAHIHNNKLQVLQSKCLRIATNAPWYVSNRQIHEYLGIPLFADHIRTLTESGCGEPLSSAAWKALVTTMGRLKSPAGNRGGLTLCRQVEAAPKQVTRFPNHGGPQPK
jgi:hypothetical protein